MRARTLITLVAALALLLAACGDADEDTAGSDEGGSAEETAEEESADASEPDAEEPAEDELELEQPEPQEPVDLEDGIAATVNGNEIAADTVDERFDAVVAIPEIEEQLAEQEDPGLGEGQLQAQILSNLIAQHIIAEGADDLGVEPTDEQVAEIEAEEMEAAGGEEAFAEALEEQGISDEQREQEFRHFARVELIQEELAEDLDDEALEGMEGMEDVDPGQLAFQEWISGRLAETEVEVDEEYGVWNPQMGQVMPADSMG